MTQQLILNAVNVQKKLMLWLGESPNTIKLIYNESLSNDRELHFDAYNIDNAENDDDDENETPKEAPEITEAMWLATRNLGSHYTFQEQRNRLHITVRGPDATRSQQLLGIFNQQRHILAAKTYNIYVTLAALLVTFIGICVSASKLHVHWHNYESPYETMFHTIFHYFIYIGDFLLATTWPTPREL
jgi:hypothetical protein